MRRTITLFFALALTASSMAQQAKELDSLDHMIGQMILIGMGDFNKLDKKAPVFKDIQSGKVGGVILFEKNLASKNTEKNLRDMLSYAQSLSNIPLFVGIDEEGGRVNRLKPKYGFPKTVTAQYLGELNNTDSTEFYAEQTAGALYGLGINMNFAPSVDVNVYPENPVIGKIGRSYSPDPAVVATHAAKVVEAHDLFGVATVVKHFPGHGSSRNDSHLGLTDVSSTWRFRELLPYKMLMDSGKVRAVMTAHIVNEVMDERKLPGTLSDRIIGGVLRGFMGYDGVVVSDDMQMKAISKEYGLEDAIKKAVNAGVDILLFANNVPDYDLVTADQIHNIIKNFIKNGDISADRIAKSYDRIMKLKADLKLTD
ncbi:glycoside hydrolase family 3 protein [Marinoscillum furvescens]|uniref:beta-N-acetylhexosaminidase n=1 Tax=Marinoscillum furvescens DSM 4134 TaxID=1122208 RepID=A0A3D9L4Q1_MARFU|nr:glycoside hydrolase family 3 N-terminal domain-containing protein [Marinoscillum furvescens]RED98907.1 beta-N-acetylhexosaminidase [Marinoscillum furvescens DSM 4134]